MPPSVPRRRLRVRRAASSRRSRHRRHRHRLRAHRARPRRRRFRARAQIQDRDPLHRRRGRLVPRQRAALRRQTRAHARRQGRRRQRRRHQGADRARRVALQGHAAPPISAFLAFEGARHLPRDAAMVRRHRQALRGFQRRHLARARGRRHRRHPLVSARGREPHRRDGARPSRLGAVASARLGRAHRRVRPQEDRRASARRRRQQAHRRCLRSRRCRLLVQFAAVTLPRRAQRRRLRASHRHPRRLVRLRFHPRLRGRKPDHRRLAEEGPRRSLSRRLRSAPRLVPVLAAGILRHARPRALRRRADAWLRARRAGPQDVEIARQRRRAPEDRAAERRGDPAPLGREFGFHRRPSHRE